MSAVAILLDDLARQGIKLQRDGEMLKVEARRSLLTPALMDRLRTRKTAILAVIDRRQMLAKPRVSGLADIIKLWPDEDLERFHERAAIREFDGGLTRAAAELAAFEDLTFLRGRNRQETSSCAVSKDLSPVAGKK